MVARLCPVVQWGVMDWIELRHFKESELRAKGPDVWSDLCSSIEQSIKSYNRLYASVSDVESTRSVHKNHMRVTRPYYAGESASATHNTLELTYDPDTSTVKGIFSAPFREVMLPIRIDELGKLVSLYYQTNPVTIEQSSKILLETMFFGPFD